MGRLQKMRTPMRPVLLVLLGLAAMAVLFGALSPAYAQDKMYWASEGKKILRANLDGTGVEELVVREDFLGAISVDPVGGKLYWMESPSGGAKLMHANLDGSNIEDLITGFTFTGFTAVDAAGGKLYFIEPLTDKIQRANLDGSDVETIVSKTSSFRGMALDTAGGKIYWSDRPIGRERDLGSI